MFEKRIPLSKKLDRVNELTEQAVRVDLEYQREAKEDFNFRNGDQWPAEEKMMLAEAKRPCLTFNLTKASVDLVMGLNEDQKIRYRAVPVNKEDGILADVLNKIMYRLHEEGEWNSEEDDAFESMLICGRGWVAVDFNYDPKRFGYIKIDETSVPVHEIYKDPGSRRRDLEDASYILWERWMTAEDFKIKYPKSKAKVDEAFDTGLVWRIQDPHNDSQSPYDDDFSDITDIGDYETPMDLDWYDKARRMVRVVHMEYWKGYTRHYVRNPETKKVEEITIPWKEFKEWFAEQWPGVEMQHSEVQDKKVHWMQFIKDEILYDDESPMEYDGFSIVPIFGYMDASKRSTNTFGIVREIKDAQREVNKRWSQMLNLINNQVQPGLYAETDAFVDRDQAEQALKIPGDVAYVNPGAISKKMLQERTIPAFPTSIMALEEAAQAMIKRISGINTDLHGQDSGRAEPGVVVRMRQQQGLTILKPIFKSYKKMRKDLTKRLINIILSYMPVEQMAEILGGDEVYAIQPDDNNQPTVIHKETGATAPLENVKNLDYHLDLEETSDSQTQRTFELSTLLEMQQGGFMVDPLAIIDKMDISASDKERWTKYIVDQQNAASQAQNNQFEMEQKKIEMQHMREMKRLELQHEQAIGKLILQAKRDEAKDENDEEANQVDLVDALLRYRSEMARAQVQSNDAHIKAATDVATTVIKANADVKKAKQTGDKTDAKGRNKSKE